MVHRHHDATAVAASSGTGRYTSLLPTPLDLVDVGSNASPAARSAAALVDEVADTPPVSQSSVGGNLVRKGQAPRASLTITPEGSYERPSTRTHRGVGGAAHRPRLLVAAPNDDYVATGAAIVPPTAHVASTPPNSASHSLHRRGGGGAEATESGSLGILEIFARARVLPAADGVTLAVDGGTPAPPGGAANSQCHHSHVVPSSSDRRGDRHRLPPSSFGRAAVAEMTRRAPAASKSLHLRDPAARDAEGHQLGNRLAATAAPGSSLEDASGPSSAKKANAQHTMREFQAFTPMSAIGQLLADACRCIIRESGQRCASVPLDVASGCGCRMHEEQQQQQQRSLSGSISPASRSRTSALASTSSFDLVTSKPVPCGSPSRSRLASPPVPNLLAQRHFGFAEGEEDDVHDIQTLLNELCAAVKFGGSGPLVVVASLIYLNRIASTCKCERYQITTHNWCRLVTVCLLVATKMFIEEEHGRVNQKFAAAANIDLCELRKLEIHMLYLIDFALVIQEDEVAQWCDWMHVVATRRGMRTPLQNFLFHNPPPPSPAAAGSGGLLLWTEAQPNVLRSPAVRPQLPLAPDALIQPLPAALDAAPRLFSSVDNVEDGPWAEEESEAKEMRVLLPPSPPPLLDNSPLKHFQLAASHGGAAAKRDDDDLQDFFRMARTATLVEDVAPSGGIHYHQRSSTRQAYATELPESIQPQVGQPRHLKPVEGRGAPEELGGAARFLRGSSFAAKGDLGLDLCDDDEDDSPWSRAKSHTHMRLSPLSR